MLSLKPTFSLSSFTFIKMLITLCLFHLRIVSTLQREKGNMSIISLTTWESWASLIPGYISIDSFCCFLFLWKLTTYLSKELEAIYPFIQMNACDFKKVKVKSLSRVLLLFVTTWTVAYQAPPSMGFSRQEYWSGLQADALPSEPPGKPMWFQEWLIKMLDWVSTNPSWSIGKYSVLLLIGQYTW